MRHVVRVGHAPPHRSSSRNADEGQNDNHNAQAATARAAAPTRADRQQQAQSVHENRYNGHRLRGHKAALTVRAAGKYTLGFTIQCGAVALVFHAPESQAWFVPQGILALLSKLINRRAHNDEHKRDRLQDRVDCETDLAPHCVHEQAIRK